MVTPQRAPTPAQVHQQHHEDVGLSVPNFVSQVQVSCTSFVLQTRVLCPMYTRYCLLLCCQAPCRATGGSRTRMLWPGIPPPCLSLCKTQEKGSRGCKGRAGGHIVVKYPRTPTKGHDFPSHRRPRWRPCTPSTPLMSGSSVGWGTAWIGFLRWTQVLLSLGRSPVCGKRL